MRQRNARHVDGHRVDGAQQVGIFSQARQCLAHGDDIDIPDQPVAQRGIHEAGRLDQFTLGAAHAHQGFVLAHAIARQRVDRLGEHLHAIVLERASQPVGPAHVDTSPRDQAVVLGITLQRARPDILGCKTGRVRRLHHARFLLDRIVDRDQTDTAADLQSIAVPQELVCVDRVDQAPRNMFGILDRAVFEQQRELIAAQPTQHVFLSDRLQHAVAELAQHFVAGVVAVGIVDDLEVIQ